ncbi:hypothetical protein MNEG_5344 [Monoraphidium neglectum]|uniref:Histone H2B n=1 Tax=Monoraphidium neglectum TaxID=145388 RepID=A0A0D2JUW6_9CHLO|nr:hypothetical protein MNEG_5344 [Monoraphidium neglectum]KIZ02618.1 hypothetical protein MNEG_5344 [Monoraphidium neglectum]|eukprot:XP_013901637.1 hypothetical protein MNEG_5344 [Monoraphidium neglectum]
MAPKVGEKGPAKKGPAKKAADGKAKKKKVSKAETYKIYIYTVDAAGAAVAYSAGPSRLLASACLCPASELLLVGALPDGKL